MDTTEHAEHVWGACLESVSEMTMDNEDLSYEQRYLLASV